MDGLETPLTVLIYFSLQKNRTETTSLIGKAKGKDKEEDYANQGSNNISEGSLTPMKRNNIVDVEEYKDSGINYDCSSTKVAIKKEKI